MTSMESIQSVINSLPGDARFVSASEGQECRDSAMSLIKGQDEGQMTSDSDKKSARFV